MEIKSFLHLRKGKQYWQNLGLAAVLGFYLALVASSFSQTRFFEYWGGDYRAFWSAGRIALTEGFDKVYDLARMEAYQREILFLSPSQEFFPAPFVYLPVFILPFMLFALLPASLSYLMWTLVNIASLIGYIYLFQRRLGGTASKRLEIILLLSFAVFQNFVWGQVNVWLVVAVGEFLLAMLRNQHLKAGIFLAGLWLKPQLLVIIVPFLLLERCFRILLGFTLLTSVLFVVSFYLSSIYGIQMLIDLWTSFSVGIPTNAPEKMMNWRMVAIDLGFIVHPWVGYTVAALGIAATIYSTAKLLQNILSSSSTQLGLKLLGTFAASLTIAWHAHEHTAMILFPFFLYLRRVYEDIEDVCFYWAIVPALGMWAGYVLYLLYLDGILADIVGLTDFIYGSTNLLLALYVLFWAYRKYIETREIS